MGIPSAGDMAGAPANTRWPSCWRTAARWLGVCTAGIAVQCTAQHEGDAGEGAEDGRSLALSLVRDIDLESGGAPPLMGIDHLAVDSAGNLFVVDATAGRVHKYAAHGEHLGSVVDPDGEATFFRQPAGPGPGAVAVGRDGNIYVAAAPHSMFGPQSLENAVTGAISRVSPGLAIDTVFTVRGPESIRALVPWRDDLAVVLHRRPEAIERAAGRTEDEARAREELVVLTYDGVPAKAFHPEDERKYEVSYWTEWFRTYAVAAEDDLLVVSSLYPIYRYGPGGELEGTFGSSSASFRQPSRPEPGEFLTADARFLEWRASFTTIDGIHVVADSLVVVVLEDRNAAEPAVAEKSYRADVFDARSGDVVARDVGLEGPVLHSDTLLYVAWRPAQDGWHIGLFDFEKSR